MKHLKKYLSIHAFIPTLLLSSLVLVSCHKTCTCIRYDGAEKSYSADEVDERGVTCANMVFQSGVQYYSVCDWE